MSGEGTDHRPAGHAPDRNPAEGARPSVAIDAPSGLKIASSRPCPRPRTSRTRPDRSMTVAPELRAPAMTSSPPSGLHATLSRRARGRVTEEQSSRRDIPGRDFRVPEVHFGEGLAVLAQVEEVLRHRGSDRPRRSLPVQLPDRHPSAESRGQDVLPVRRERDVAEVSRYREVRDLRRPVASHVPHLQHRLRADAGRDHFGAVRRERQAVDPAGHLQAANVEHVLDVALPPHLPDLQVAA